MCQLSSEVRSAGPTWIILVWMHVNCLIKSGIGEDLHDDGRLCGAVSVSWVDIDVTASVDDIVQGLASEAVRSGDEVLVESHGLASTITTVRIVDLDGVGSRVRLNIVLISGIRPPPE